MSRKPHLVHALPGGCQKPGIEYMARREGSANGPPVIQFQIANLSWLQIPGRPDQLGSQKYDVTTQPAVRIPQCGTVSLRRAI